MLASSDRVIANRYVLEGALGAGGMGEVWKGRHLELDLSVAVKLLPATLAVDSVAIERFRREARTAARLKSPHVIQVLDFGLENGLPYIVMELLAGESLKQRLASRRRLSLSEVNMISRHVCRALELAHAEGIVHRDVKPSNLFFTRAGSEEVLKVLDFGIAKFVIDSEVPTTLTGVVVGSPGFMSPEQAGGDSVDARSDLWSLGAVLFLALTGEPAFRSSSVKTVNYGLAEGSFPKASALCPGLPVEVDQFFERALAFDPDLRFDSATEFARSFAAAAGIKALEDTAERDEARAYELAREGTTRELSLPAQQRSGTRRALRTATAVALAVGFTALGSSALYSAKSSVGATPPLHKAEFALARLPDQQRAHDSRPPVAPTRPLQHEKEPDLRPVQRRTPDRAPKPTETREKATEPVTTDPLFGLSTRATAADRPAAAGASRSAQ